MHTLLKVIVRIGLPLAVLVALVVAWTHLPGRSGEEKIGGTWTCSMHPQVRLPRPGQCPICGMNLIPVAQLEAEQAAMGERANLETEAVGYRELSRMMRTVGKLDYNERHVAVISARIAGRVDRVYADFTGITVKEGDHLVDIYSPELFIGQDELIRATRALEIAKSAPERESAERQLELSRTKLRLWGMLPEQLKEIETTRKVQTHLTIYAPQGGTVIEKGIRAGQYVKEGDVLYRIADFDPIWLYLDIYEYDVAWVRYGQPVEVTVEAYPGGVFRGLVTFIDPFLDDKTRTVKARVNLPNRERKLKPAMYASAAIHARLRSDGMAAPTGVEGKYWCPMHPEIIQDQPGSCSICRMPLEKVPAVSALPQTGHEGHGADQQKHAAHAASNQVLAVRASAVLDTGRRKIAYRQAKDNNYALVELTLGPRALAKDDGGQQAEFFPVLNGLAAGDRVVVRGGFLLDSQRQIEGRASLLYAKGQSGASLHAGHGQGAAAPPKPTPPVEGHKH